MVIPPRVNERRRAALAALFFLFGACASGGTTASSDGSAAESTDPRYVTTLTVSRGIPGDTIVASRQVAWTALAAAYQTLGLRVAIVDSASQSVATGLMRVHQFLGKRPLSLYLDCGRTAMGNTADSYEVTLRVRSTVEGVGPEATVIRTAVRGVATPQGSGPDTFRCSTTGVLESRIAALAASQARP